MSRSALSVGSSGDEIKALHIALTRAGLYVPPSEVERLYFGPGTRLAVQQFQQKQGFPVTGDVDNATATQLSLEPQQQSAAESARGGAPPWMEIAASAPFSDQPPTAFDGLVQFGRAYAAFGAGICRSFWDINWSYAVDGAQYAVNALSDQSPGIEVLVQELAFGTGSYAAEVASVLPVELDRLSRQIDADARRRREPPPLRFGSAPPHSHTHVVAGVPVVLPVRIVDASQGFAIYFVDATRLQRHLDEQGEPFTVVVFGDGRTPLSIMGVDYRETDLGVYYELGVCAMVRPRHDPTETPGTLFLSLTVSDYFNVPRAKELWGYSKTFSPNMAFTYHRNSVHVAIDRNDPKALSVTLPRFGMARSRDIPRYTWGVKEGTPCKMVIARSGRGEGLQIGGDVKLTLGDGTQARCVCKLDSGRGYCVCLLLRDLGLPQHMTANTWSESISALCMESVLCHE
jgi:putative peptidoglycan binding protein